jgi:hypothetical protein
MAYYISITMLVGDADLEDDQLRAVSPLRIHAYAGARRPALGGARPSLDPGGLG